MSVIVIAEAGVNHNGDVKIAKRLIDEAKNAGADIVKFQTFDVKKLVSKYAVMADYQKANLGREESQEKMLSKLAIGEEEFRELYEYCNNKAIRFLSTPFDIDSICFLNELQDIWKIPSGEITDYPYLVKIAQTGKDVILSTGMSSLDEVDDALSVLRDNGAGKITLLHCTTDYPASMESVNLRAMLTLKERFNCDVGYSDHTKGIEVPIAAAALGAVVIEKHFTLDRTMEGPDHKASIEPSELRLLVESVRNIEKAMGDGIKSPTDSEKKNISVVRKSIIAAKSIKVGEMLTVDNLTTKRPGTGISPMRWNDVVGTVAVRDFDEDELITV